jgi:hypothetical protein
VDIQITTHCSFVGVLEELATSIFYHEDGSRQTAWCHLLEDFFAVSRLAFLDEVGITKICLTAILLSAGKKQ